MSEIHLLSETRFHTEIRKLNSPSAMGAVELLRSAFWVLSYPMPAQALMLFHQALEVACKGLLQEVHLLLAADKADYDLSKWAVRGRLAAHRLGRNMHVEFDIDEYDPSRTCSFDDAWKRVREMSPSLRSFKDAGLGRLTALRNQITHLGAEENREFEYSQAILKIAIPAIEEFYEKCYDGLSLTTLIGEVLLRELRVAQQYLLAIDEDESLPTGRLLETFICKYQEPLVFGVAHLLFDEVGNMLDLSWDRSEVNRKIYSRLDSQYDKRGSLLGESLFLSCKICDNAGIIVGIEDEEYTIDGRNAVDPCSLFCPSCGLNLDKSYKLLAKLHFGPITEEMIGAEAWKNEIPR
jgi:hypothetical protein